MLPPAPTPAPYADVDGVSKGREEAEREERGEGGPRARWREELVMRV